MEKDMSQECTKIAEDWHKRAPNLTTHWSKLSQDKATKTTKKTVKPFLTLVGPHFSRVFVFYTHYAKDHLPKSIGKEKKQPSGPACLQNK